MRQQPQQQQEVGWLHQVAQGPVGVVQGAREWAGKLIPPPLVDRVEPLSELAPLTRSALRKTTMTVMSSWKWRRTPRSILLRSEYLISRFFAASRSAALISRRAIPCRRAVNCGLMSHASKTSRFARLRLVANDIKKETTQYIILMQNEITR